jgi:uncharacterized protein with von Willebrand factor type A (vWA) domain
VTEAERGVAFALRLRAVGVVADTTEIIAFLQAVQTVGPRDLRESAVATFARSPQDCRMVRQLFDEFWHHAGTEPPIPKVMPEEPRSGDIATVETTFSTASVGEQPAIQRREAAAGMLYSAYERLGSKDFAALTDDEMRLALTCVGSMRIRDSLRRSHRLVSSRRGRSIDVRKLLRRSAGGRDLDSITWRRRKLKPRKIVALCDVSGSMEPYSRMLLHVLHTMQRGPTGNEAFVFSTRLTRVTTTLRGRHPDEALAVAGSSVLDWAGGTRIGSSIGEFNRSWASRVGSAGAIVLIVSDGWDRGPVEVIQAELERLQRSSYRLLWLNPLVGAEGYEPATQGMAAAIPYIDRFLSIRNLNSLVEFADALGQL